MNNELFNSPEYETTYISKTATYKTFDIMVANFGKISHWVKNGSDSTIPFPKLFQELREAANTAEANARQANETAQQLRNKVAQLEDKNNRLTERVETLSEQLLNLQNLLSGAGIQQSAPVPPQQPQQPVQDTGSLFNSPEATTPPPAPSHAVEIEALDEAPVKTASVETGGSTPAPTASGVETPKTSAPAETMAPQQEPVVSAAPKTPEVKQFEVTASQIDAGEVQDNVLASLEAQIEEMTSKNPLES